MAVVRVAVAVVLVGNQVLLAKRRIEMNHSGFWELLGGKIEAEETPQAALVRELKEEVGVDFSSANITPPITLSFTYPEVEVHLEVFTLDAHESALKQAYGAEKQEIRWVSISELENYEFPKANVAILEALKDRAVSK